jgi:hypothetical protein
MATYVNDLRLKEIATGDEAGTWGTSTNTNLELIAEAFSFGTEAITTNADTHTTTIADGSTDPGRSIYLKYTGTLDSACTITIGPNTVSKLWFIENGTSGSQNIIISQGSGANVTIPAGDVKAVYSDGAGSGAAIVDAFASLNVVDLKVEDDLTVTDDATVGGTLGVTGVLTANAGVVVDNITIDGTEIDLSSGDLTIDVAGDIILDAGDGDVIYHVAGADRGRLTSDSNGFTIRSDLNNGDLIFKGVDGGSEITALTFDMSEAGKATFNSDIVFGGTGTITSATNSLKALNTGDNGFLIRSAVSSAANPSYSNVDDTNTGIFLPGSDVIGLTTGGSEHARITSDGSVGIGTTSPGGSTSCLHVVHDATEGTPSFPDGEVIIAQRNFNSSQGCHVGIIAGTASESAINFGDKDDSDIGSVSYNHSSNFMSFTTNTSEGARLTSAGLLQLGTAIGNSTYAGLFNGVSNVGTGAIIQTRNGDGKKHFMLRGDNNVEYGSVGLSASSGSASLQLQGENTIVFNTNTDTERFRIDGDGDLCIGTTAGFRGSEKVSVVAGTVDCFAGYTHAAFAVARKASFVNTFFLLFEANNGSAIGSITSDGSSVTYNTSSDYRLKENIQPMEDGLERLKQLNPIKFNWKEAGTESEGFLAHEVQTIFPEAVDGEKDGEKIQSMDYGRITPLLVKAIQEQQEQIDALQSEIQSLKGE